MVTSSVQLTTRGSQLVDGEGRPVTLRGFGLGGWMNMENFITGYPANEEAQREAVREVLGEEKYELFFDRFLEHFFCEDDALFIRSLNLNLLRLPANYRHFESDMKPFVIKEEGFKHLDRVINLCAQQEIYTIIDLHALPGYQNQHWHSDNPTHKALLWRHKHFQDRTVNLWEANRYSLDFHMFGEPWEKVVYTNHDYALPGFIDGGPYPGVSRGEYVDKEVLERTFLERSGYMLEHGVPIWVGEFGPVYTGEVEADAMRYRLLRDQLEIYTRYGVNWSIWTYKDIGLQGVVYASPSSAWIARIRPVLEKKARLGVDHWGGKDTEIRHVMEPLERLFAEEYPEYDPFPFGAKRHIELLVRNILLAEPLLKEYGGL